MLDLVERWPVTGDGTPRPLSVAELAREALGGDDRTTVESARRAARRLVDEGHLHRGDDGRVSVAAEPTVSDSRAPGGVHYRTRRFNHQDTAGKIMLDLYSKDHSFPLVNWSKVTPEDWWLPTVQAAISQLRTLEKAIRRQVAQPPPAKPRKADHPATFPAAVLAVIRARLEEHLPDGGRVLDPFAGVGTIHGLRASTLLHPGFATVGVELQPCWARSHPATIVGSADALPFPDDSFDAIATSPTYGNRMADHHNARDDSYRNTYHHRHLRQFGEGLDDGNAGLLQWGPKYRELHEACWAEAARVLRPGGVFVLNIKDHDRTERKGGPKVRQPVAAWHVATLEALGLNLLTVEDIATGGLPSGSNTSDPHPEQVYVLRRDTV